ncbi:hypothetical protein ID866_8709 [Astraeus odoratus]|nr:hypothetical protein ID866_8709 [Astraeus odoratus]
MILADFVAAIVAILHIYYLYITLPPKGLPPGISGLRCILEIPSGKMWLKMLEVKRKYGDMASWSVLGYNIIMVNSAQIAQELLDKRAINYADRPRSVMGGELSGWGKTMLLSNYDNWFRMHRKWMAREIGNYRLANTFQDMIEYETRRFLWCVLNDPERIHAHVRKNNASIILRITYGYKTIDGDDPLVALAQLASSHLSLSTAPGAYYVDFVPLLKYVPSWLPGAGFKRKAKVYSAVVRDLVQVPYNIVKTQMAASTASLSMVARLLNECTLKEEYEDSVKWASAAMFHGDVFWSPDNIKIFVDTMSRSWR